METEFSVFHLLPRNVNYITSWLSMVGPAVGLNLPLSYATAASQDEGNVGGQGKKRSLRSTFPVAKILGPLLHLAMLPLLAPAFIKSAFISDRLDTDLFV